MCRPSCRTEPVTPCSSFSYTASPRSSSHTRAASFGFARRITSFRGASIVAAMPRAARARGARRSFFAFPRAIRPFLTWLLSDHLDQHALLAPAIELAVEDLLPRPEIELAPGHRHHHLAPHHLALEV